MRRSRSQPDGPEISFALGRSPRLTKAGGGDFVDANMRQVIQAAIQILRSNPKSSDEEILGFLIDSGIQRPLAIQLVTLLPLAYTRVMLADSGLSFSATYMSCDEGGKSRRESRLDGVPPWNEMIAFARHEVSGGVGREAVISVAIRSSEFQAINNALNGGSKLKNLVISPPVIMSPEFHASVGLDPAVKELRRWWQVWK